MASTRRPGYLTCSRCKRSVPYQGMPESDLAMADWPKHRCLDSEIRPFEAFTVQDPNRLPIGGAL